MPFRLHATLAGSLAFSFVTEPPGSVMPAMKTNSISVPARSAQAVRRAQATDAILISFAVTGPMSIVRLTALITKTSFTCLRPSESVGDAVAVIEPETETLPVDVAVRVDTEDTEAAAVLKGSNDGRETSLGFCEDVAA